MKSGMGRGKPVKKELEYPVPLAEFNDYCNTAILYNTNRVFNVENPVVSASKTSLSKITLSSSINVQDPEIRVWTTNPTGYLYPFVRERNLPYYKGWAFMGYDTGDNWWYGCPTLFEDPFYSIFPNYKSTYPCYRRCTEHPTDWYAQTFPLLAYYGTRNNIPYNNPAAKSPRFSTFFTDSPFIIEQIANADDYRAFMVVKTSTDYGEVIDEDSWIIYPSLSTIDATFTVATGLIIRLEDGTTIFQKADWVSTDTNGYIDFNGGYGLIINPSILDSSGGDIFIDVLYGFRPAEYTNSSNETLPPNTWAPGYVPSNLPDINLTPGVGGDMSTWSGYVGTNGMLDTEEFIKNVPSGEYTTTGVPQFNGLTYPSGISP